MRRGWRGQRVWAEPTRLELATSTVTGWRSNQIDLRLHLSSDSRSSGRRSWPGAANVVVRSEREPSSGFEPETPCLQDRCSTRLSYEGRIGGVVVVELGGFEPPPPGCDPGVLPVVTTAPGELGVSNSKKRSRGASARPGSTCGPRMRVWLRFREVRDLIQSPFGEESRTAGRGSALPPGTREDEFSPSGRRRSVRLGLVSPGDGASEQRALPALDAHACDHHCRTPPSGGLRGCHPSAGGGGRRSFHYSVAKMPWPASRCGLPEARGGLCGGSRLGE